MDYQRRYEEIVADYNREKDRVTIEETFRRLTELMADLRSRVKKERRWRRMSMPTSGNRPFAGNWRGLRDDSVLRVAHSRADRSPSQAFGVDEVATSCYKITMRSVGIKVLNSRLSQYIRLAASGETVLVTDRDRVVAEIGPPRETRSPLVADALLAEAVRAGWLTPPVLPAAGGPPASKPIAPLSDILGELDDDRSDR